MKIPHTIINSFGKANGLTIVIAPWHPQNAITIFETGTLLSKNLEYPSGLVIVDEKGKSKPFHVLT